MISQRALIDGFGGNESDTDTDEKDMYTDDEDIEVKAYLVGNPLLELLGNESDLPDKVRQSRFYRRAKKKYFVENIEHKTVPEVLSQLSQVPESVRITFHLEFWILAQAALRAPPEVALQCVTGHCYYQLFTAIVYFSQVWCL